jgi:tetratricopeptide (TPR) repeat protein
MRTVIRLLPPLLLFIAAGCSGSSPSGGTLSETCYSDTRCLTAEVTRYASAVETDHLPQFIGYAVRLGLFDVARASAKNFDSGNLIGRLNLQNANQTIAGQQVADDSWRSPEKIVSLAPLEALPEQADSFGLEGYLGLAVDAMVHRSPWASMEAHLSEIFRPRMVLKSKNATLTYILESKWPDAIGKLTPVMQGVAWNDLARVWLELGKPARAKKALEEADSVVAKLGVQRFQFQNWRTWMNLGDYARALQAANTASDRSSRGFYELAIGRALIAAGRNEQARAIILGALPDVATEANFKQMGELLRAEEELIDAGDAADAHNVAAELAALARQPQMLPSGAFTTVATAYNNLGEHQQADAWLTRAVGRVPGRNQVVGFGVTLGPISGATLGLGEDLRSGIAVELYRAGNLGAFDAQLHKLSAEYQARTWSALCDPEWGHETPTEAACIQGAGPEILLRRAVDAAARADTTASVQYLSRTIQAYENGKPDRSVDRLLDSARLSLIDGRTDLMNEAMIAAARVADHLPDPDDREVGLAKVAALREELLT